MFDARHNALRIDFKKLEGKALQPFISQSVAARYKARHVGRHNFDVPVWDLFDLECNPHALGKGTERVGV